MYIHIYIHIYIYIYIYNSCHTFGSYRYLCMFYVIMYVLCKLMRELETTGFEASLEISTILHSSVIMASSV